MAHEHLRTQSRISHAVSRPILLSDTEILKPHHVLLPRLYGQDSFSSFGVHQSGAPEIVQVMDRLPPPLGLKDKVLGGMLCFLPP